MCPALTDGYQLFRQQAYAQGIADSGLFDLVVSGVAYDKRNKTLISCLKSVRINDFASDWSRLFNTSVRFHCFTHQELVSWATKSKSGEGNTGNYSRVASMKKLLRPAACVRR